MWILPVGSMYGVGKQTSIKLQNMGMRTIRDLALSDRDYLISKLGKMGGELHLLANGIDLSPVAPHCKGDMKSIGRSVTLSHDTTDIEYAKSVLFELSDDVGMTARKHKKKGHTVQIVIKYSDFKSITRQMSVPATCLVKDIYAAGVKLLKANWDRKPIRLLGISLSGFDKDYESRQLSLFEIPGSGNDMAGKSKIDSLENAIHNIREKYGSSIIKPGVIIDKDNKIDK
jgi:DNA polymerase-4